ncbi:uncharacterized protein [Palaemon carinicauda]|uniref:uncharacterized protein isoform X2 n=1 Tax=Palaemon carinicauda TaxID=392227 RepID=UPI0035B581A0
MILLLLCVLTAVTASSLDQQIQTSNEKETAIFKIPKNGSTYLAFLTSDQDASFTFEIDGFNFTKDGEESSTQVTFQTFEPDKWHFMRIFKGENKNGTQVKRVKIFPNTVYNMTGDLEEPRNISIKSHGQIYWTQCKEYHSCYFSGSVLCTECTNTSILITTCGLLILAVVGLVVFIIRGKEFKPKEDAINEEVDLAENFGNFDREQVDHESVNSLYGAVIHRQE